MKSEQFYVRTPGEDPVGPLDRKIIEDMIASKQIHPGAMFCALGSDSWEPKLPHQGKLQARVAIICLAVAALAWLVANFTNLMKMSAPAFLGSWIGSTLALWGLCGLTVFFSTRGNVLKNWVYAILGLSALILIGNWLPKEQNKKPKAVKYELTSQKTGRKYIVEFDREPTDVDVDEAVKKLDAQQTRFDDLLK